VIASDAADPGFRAGEAKSVQETAIPASLLRRESIFVAEADGSRTTLLVPVTSRRGHDFGWIGLTLPAGEKIPPATAVQERVTAMADTL
jgi:ribose transport system ATP-binding protein/rhamnose transport system ATP-binding protein